MSTCHPPARRHLPRRHLRGAIHTGLLVTISLIVSIAGVATITLPRISAASNDHDKQRALSRKEIHAQATIQRIVSESHRVMHIVPRGDTPYAEVVLWTNDTHHPGRMDADEVVVLSHSQVLQTVSVYRLKADSRPQSSHVPISSLSSPSPASGLEAGLSSSAFCDRWRARPDVQVQTLAHGVHDMQFKSESAQSDLQIELIWAADFADDRAGRSGSFDPILPGSIPGRSSQ
ncbi:MAG: hypothetical protein ACR2GY_01605 [Phycisphaerales bacterium]